MALNKRPAANPEKLASKLTKVPTLNGPTAKLPKRLVNPNPTPGQAENPSPGPRKITVDSVRRSFEAQEKAGTISPYAQQRLNEDRALRKAEQPPSTGKLKKLGKPGGNPTPGEDPRKIKVDSVRRSFEAQEKAGTISPYAQQRLNEDRAARKAEQSPSSAPQPGPLNPGDGVSSKDPGNDSDKDNGKGRGRPPLIVVVPGHVGEGRSDGDRQDGGGYRYAPSMVEPAPRYSVPRSQSRPQQLQPAKIKKDEPVCVEGVWAMQDNEKKYVCLSWYFRGQIYTPDQMAQVLAQLQPQAQ